MLRSNLTPETTRKMSKTIGRGGKRGKTSGRGTKGQWAHGGHGVRPELRDIIKKYPKLRGRGVHSNKPIGPQPVGINLYALELAYVAGEEVNLDTLLAKGLINRACKMAKILGSGTLSKALTVKGLQSSATAKEAILKVGGKVLTNKE